jgi:hypothetical protein
MVVDFSKILSHPEKDEIISKLMTGIRSKDVADWLRLKYPNKDQGHLRLGGALLKEFADSNLDLYTQIQQDVSGIKNGQPINKEIAASLRNNKTYRERLNELADKEIDLKKTLRNAVFLMEARMEQYFDKMQENPGALKADYGLIKWFEVLINAVEKANKVINEAPDVVVQHNVNVQTANQYTIILQDAIRETCAEVDPQMAFLFMEKMNEKLPMLEEPKPQVMSLENKINEVQVLNTKVNALLENEEEQ